MVHRAKTEELTYHLVVFKISLASYLQLLQWLLVLLITRSLVPLKQLEKKGDMEKKGGKMKEKH